jgi:hypothetical protein
VSGAHHDSAMVVKTTAECSQSEAGRSRKRQRPRLLSAHPPSPSRQSSLIRASGLGQKKGADCILSARQSPSSQSAFSPQSVKVVVISHVAPERAMFARARSTFANDRCTRQSRHRMTSQPGRSSQVRSASRGSRKFPRSCAPLKVCDQVRDDIDPVIGQAQVCSMYQGRITTGCIQQGTSTQIPQQRRQISSQCPGCLGLGPQAGNRALSTPEIDCVNTCETFLERKSAKGLPTCIKPLVRQNRWARWVIHADG